MRSFDFTPLYRSSVGFDRLASLLDQVNNAEQRQPSYPPYNIERLDADRYEISVAVAGFEPSELDIESHDGVLTVSGKKPTVAKQSERQFLHRGIGQRDFELRYQLDSYVKVAAAKLENGLLRIALVRELPEAMKPRKIAIDAAQPEALSQTDAKTKTVNPESEQQAA